MHYFIVAGEASGDIHAAKLIDELRRLDSEARFTFTGGDRMAAAAGHAPLIHYRDMAFMGFSEVLRHLGRIGSNMRAVKHALETERPDCVILVDYPSFNLRVAAKAARLGIPVYYYISPKVWAWKKWRVRTIKRLVRKVYAIFPFETEFYARHGYEADYVGNPSVEEVAEGMAAARSREEFLRINSLRDRPIVALLPGSRRGEIRNNLPVMAAVMKRFPQYRGVIAGAPGIDRGLYKAYCDLPVVDGDTFSLLASARAALVTSGTATLETALAGVPQVVTYRANGSRPAYNIMKRVLDIAHVSLPNIVAGRTVVPEMLVHLCTPDLVAGQLAPLLRDTPERRAMADGYDEVKRRLGTNRTAAATARLLTDDLRHIRQEKNNNR